MNQDPTGFSKSLLVTHENDGTEFLFHKIELDDKIIFNIHVNGVIDTTIDLPIGSKQVISNALGSTTDSEGVEPIILVGNHANMKIQIIATQLSKLFIKYSSKSVILSIGSRWFGQELQPNDFDNLMWVSEQVNKVLQS